MWGIKSRRVEMFAVREEDADDIGVGYGRDCVSVPFSEQQTRESWVYMTVPLCLIQYLFICLQG